MHDHPLARRTCLITGAGSGIGRAMALQFAHDGAEVALVGRSADELEAVAKQIRDSGGIAEAFVADVTDAPGMADIVERVVAQWGPIKVAVANAGANGVWAPLDKLSVADFRETLDNNLTGTFITLKVVYPAMKMHGGSMIVVSSINGTRIYSNRGSHAYSSSKAGQVALVKTLALELGLDNIRINAICPGAIDTPIHDKTVRQGVEDPNGECADPHTAIPLTDNRPGEPEQVAKLARFLASDDAQHITGAVIHIDGAQSLGG